MKDMRNLYQAIEGYIRPATFPVAMKLLKSEAEIPKGIDRALKMFGHKVMLCQGWSLARHNSEAMAMLKDDIHCPPAIITLGLAERVEFFREGNLFINRYTPSKEASIEMASTMPSLPVGDYVGLVTAPVQICNFDPDLVVVFCNPLQAKRLIQAALVKEGGRFTASFGVTGSCSEIITSTIQTGRCQFSFPDGGHRCYDAVSAEEVMFSIPSERLEEVVFGLKYTDEHGLNFPPHRWVDIEPRCEKERGNASVIDRLREML